MLTLTIDSSRFAGSVGLFDGIKERISVRFDVKATFSEKLLYMTDFILSEAGYSLKDVELLGINSGPGSFTGLRIGMSIAKGMAYAKGIPVVKVNTLHMIAMKCLRDGEKGVPLFDARKGQVFAALLEKENGALKEIIPTGAYKLDDFIGSCDSPESLLFMTEEKYRNEIRPLVSGSVTMLENSISSYPDSCARLALKAYEEKGPCDLYALEPDYYRASDAEINYDKNSKA